MSLINDVLQKIKEISADAVNMRSAVSVDELQRELNINRSDMLDSLQYLKGMRFITFMDTPVAYIRLTLLGFNVSSLNQ
ncbi:MAG: hypothetical protein BGO69_18500 [Bacteroidetes bacterium 46-16]|nr:MAG: hypothetical protein BGO69_18500 [Bacteroidetes bacterium 46-16]